MSCKNCYVLTLKYDRLESQYRELRDAMKEMAKKAQGLDWVTELRKQRPARLESLRKEVERREHYVKTGEWKYD
jgi:hypothetical protein